MFLLRLRRRSSAVGWLGVGALLCAGAVSASRADQSAIRPPAPADWFHIVRLDARTYELSEPKYWQQNVSYLLLGRRRALLFDTGPGLYSIRQVVRSLTQLPLIVIPSHLHFDHVGDLAEFTDVRLLDTPALRAEAQDGEFVETPAQFMLKSGIRYHVAGWVRDGQSIDLGGRTVTVYSTPGHTPDSVSILDAGGDRLFTGDLINRVVSLIDVPGSDVHALDRSLHRVLALAPHAQRAYEAHAEVPLTRAELEQLAAGVDAIAGGRAQWKPSCLGGVPMRRYDVGPFPILLPAATGHDLPPQNSSTETLDWLATQCGQ
jgi:glyoxylase-like metal-dependent hydrolase (beta-lactamase superfamily II)